MTPRKFRTPDNFSDGLEENHQGPAAIRAKLQSASNEKLIDLIERLAADSEKLSARIDYLTDTGTAAKTLQRRVAMRSLFTTLFNGIPADSYPIENTSFVTRSYA